MDFSLLVIIFVTALVSVALGVGLGYIWFHEESDKPVKDDGVIFVDNSNPDEPYLSLGLSKEDLAKIVKEKNTVRFMVVQIDNSHK